MFLALLPLIFLLLPYDYGTATPVLIEPFGNSSAECSRYSVVIDAGSSGSRVHVYKYDTCTSTSPSIIDEKFLEVKPGLSSYAPKESAESLVKLLQLAHKEVPVTSHRCTPISVKATAGLRLLGANKSDAILAAVYSFIKSKYQFRLVGEKSAVEIMKGSDEGVYAWSTINTLLQLEKKFQSETPATIMDLGGASTQIVYTAEGQDTIPEDYLGVATLQGNKREVYQHSYLGFGLKEAILRIHRFVADESIATRVYKQPCYQLNVPVKVEYNSTFSVYVPGQPDPIRCEDVVRQAMFKDSFHLVGADADCKVGPCSFNGVYHPGIPAKSPIFAFSFFYDGLAPVLPLIAHGKGDLDPTHYITNLQQIDYVQNIACSTRPSLPLFGKPWEKLEATIAAIVKKQPYYCTAVTYLRELLRAYGVSETRDINIVKKLRGMELGWSLGASSDLLRSMDQDPDSKACFPGKPLSK
jgi:guanosine-diphosphatase